MHIISAMSRLHAAGTALAIGYDDPLPNLPCTKLLCS